MATAAAAATELGIYDEILDGVDRVRLKTGEVNLGTSIMAIRFRDGVMIGADSRTTTGAYIANRVTDKLTQLTDNVWCCRSGSAADTQAVADIVHYYCQALSVEYGRPLSVRTVSNLLRELCYNNKDQLSAGLIVAGYDKATGGQVFSIPLGGSLHEQQVAIGGSGSAYIYGFVDAYFKTDMEKEEGVQFMKESLSRAMARDGSSGGVIRLAIITAAGVERLVFMGDEIPFASL